MDNILTICTTSMFSSSIAKSKEQTANKYSKTLSVKINFTMGYYSALKEMELISTLLSLLVISKHMLISSIISRKSTTTITKQLLPPSSKLCTDHMENYLWMTSTPSMTLIYQKLLTAAISSTN